MNQIEFGKKSTKKNSGRPKHFGDRKIQFSRMHQTWDFMDGQEMKKNNDFNL